MVCHQKSGSKSRLRLAARLNRKLATVTENVRTISQQNAAIRALLEHIQVQLANSSQNEEVVLLEREVDVDIAADYVIGQMIEETVVPLECNNANKEDGPVSLIGLVVQETDKIDPIFRPLKPNTLPSP